MSASEKLKALPLRGKDGRLNLTRVLPQIVAVTSAGEDIVLRPDENGMPPRDCGYVRFSEIDALRAALTALEEALS